MSSSTTSHSSSMSLSPSNPTTTSCFDPLDSLLDLSEYDALAQQSPGVKDDQHFARPISRTPPALPSASQPVLAGPSHQYNLYRQQTGIPQGAVASTLAVNQNNAHLNQLGLATNYLAGFETDEYLDFGSAPTSALEDCDMDCDVTPTDPSFLFSSQSTTSECVDPSATAFAMPMLPVSAAQSGPQRVWPGMHQQAALAKAQAQQKQQEAIIRQQQHTGSSSKAPPKSKSAALDPLVEEKISQLLRTMRHKTGTMDDFAGEASGHSTSTQKSKKDDEDMDEDERLLASEEGKKLTSKERRQLRNKVSARAFRSRRKEYIGQLEGEIAGKVNENHDLKLQNKALLEENARLSDLTRMLLSSPAFSSFLDTLATNPNPAAPQHPSIDAQQMRPMLDRPQAHANVAKDPPPHMPAQHVGMTMIPEPPRGLSILEHHVEGNYGYQPRVYSVLSVPDVAIDAELLSGKSSTHRVEEKMEVPELEVAPCVMEDASSVAHDQVDETFDADPAFALFTSDRPASPTLELPDFDLLSSKPLHYELKVVGQTPQTDEESSCAIRRLLRRCEGLEAMVSRLEKLTVDL